MMRQSNILRHILVFGLLVTLTAPAYGKRKKRLRRKKGQLVQSIREAKQRSEKEQKIIRVKLDFEADERMQSWSADDRQAIEIKYTGTNTAEPVNLGPADFSMEKEGEDHSGLNNLITPIDEDPAENINFDEELREVSSLKN